MALLKFTEFQNQSLFLESSKKKNQLQVTADFILNTDDFDIKIPSMILPKISKKVQTHLECSLQ
jgi:hypothetical protein